MEVFERIWEIIAGFFNGILGRFERKGLKVVGLRLLDVPREMAERHYAVHAGKHFYDGLVALLPAAHWYLCRRAYASRAVRRLEGACIAAKTLSESTRTCWISIVSSTGK